MKLTNEDKLAIEQSIKDIELKTSGEIVPAILAKSSLYKGQRALCSFLISILFISILHHFYSELGFYEFLIIQLATFFVLYFAFLNSFLFKLIILFNKHDIQDKVNQKAMELFYKHQISNTKDHTGILICISLLEKQIVVLADKGINGKVTKNYWASIVALMQINLKKNDIKGAVTEAFKNCSEELAKHFPIQKDDKNELPDGVVTS